MGALVDAINAMERAVNDELTFALMEGAQLVADNAKTGHTFQNRTGRLEGAIRPDSVRGSLRTGYRVRVVGARPYGSFLEEGTSRIEGFSFLLPVWERVEDEVARDVSDRMAIAASRA